MGMRKDPTFILGFIVIFILLLALLGQDKRPVNTLPAPWVYGRFHVTTRPNLLGNPDPGSIWPGMEYTLLRKFADEQGWQIHYRNARHFSALFDDLRQGRAHLAAANLSMTSDRLQQYLFTLPINHSRVVVLVHAARKDVQDWQNLPKNTRVLRGSIFEALLQQRAAIRAISINTNVLDLLDMLEKEQIEATLLDENVWLLFKPFFPNVRIAFRSREAYPIGWALPVTADGLDLKNRIDRWLRQAKQQGLLQRLKQEYLSPSEDYDPAGTFYFRKLLKKRLPRYRHLFVQAGEITALDWRLLAAMAYQESHWNPRARSHTGVRGMMMLTMTTAREMGVENRLDSEESVLGAARYLRKLIDKFPSRIPHDHRVWFALGAYNIGFRHMENARRLAQRHGADPDDWFAVKPWLARLNHPDVVRSINAWPADGQQAARYVSNIQLYYRFLLWNTAQGIKNHVPP